MGTGFFLLDRGCLMDERDLRWAVVYSLRPSTAKARRALGHVIVSLYHQSRLWLLSLAFTYTRELH